MQNALWITLIGMGLVFVAILLLWGLMALLVRLTQVKDSQLQAAEEPQAGLLAEPGQPEETAPDLERRRRAAAAAVAVALALEGTVSPAQPSRPEGALSPWQAAHRAGQSAHVRRRMA